MSGNLLGKDENLSAVKDDIMTAGESIAGLLKQHTCPLKSLNLHWNMIRLRAC